MTAAVCPVPPNTSRLHRRAGSGGHRYRAALRSGGTASGTHRTGPARTRTLCPVPTATPAADPEDPDVQTGCAVCLRRQHPQQRQHLPDIWPSAAAAPVLCAARNPRSRNGLYRMRIPPGRCILPATRLFSWIVYSTSTLRILFTHCSPSSLAYLFSGMSHR